MATKYQVFVSSTFDDLKDERNRVIQGVLELGHIPVGMEMFSAGDDEQWKIIARNIEESDYYVVIVGHRYGSVVEGMSFTEKEYRYAVEKGVPVIGFVIDDTVPWAPEKMEPDARKKKALDTFKNLVKQKPVGFWTSAEDLYGKCSVALTKAFVGNPRVGWVRASGVLGPEVTAEISRLSAENAALRRDLRDRAASDERESDIEEARDREALELYKVGLYVRYVPGGDWEKAETLSLLRIFNVVAPVLQVEGTLKSVGTVIALHAVPEGEERRPLTMALNLAGDLLTDLMSFGLIEPSKRKHSVADKNEYWSLTDRGIRFAQSDRRERIRALVDSADTVARLEIIATNEEPPATTVNS